MVEIDGKALVEMKLVITDGKQRSMVIIFSMCRWQSDNQRKLQKLIMMTTMPVWHAIPYFWFAAINCVCGGGGQEMWHDSNVKGTSEQEA